MDRDDYRDKLLKEDVRKNELQKNIGSSISQDMISRQVAGGINQESVSKTLVDTKAKESALYQKGGNAKTNEVVTRNKSKPKSDDGKSKVSKTASIKDVKEREKKRKLERKTSDAGYGKSVNVKKESFKFSSTKEEVPNREKAREAEEEDARRYQQVIYKRRDGGKERISTSPKKKTKGKAVARKYKYVIEEELPGKYTKKLNGRKRHGKGNIAADELVLKKVHEESDGNYGVEASENAIYAAKYGKKAATESAKFIKKTAHGMSDSITTTADLLRQQKNIEAKIRTAKRKSQSAKETMHSVKEVTIKLAHKAQEIIRKNLTLIISIASVLILFVAISATVSSCASAFSQGVGTYVGGLSPTTDREMTDCDSYMDELENDLQETINNIETDYPGYNEYDYDLAEIGHDYTVLMAFLSAEYADYSLSEIQTVIDGLFDEMYTLTIWDTEELRTKEVLNENTGQTEEIEYMAKILHVKLEKKELSDVVTDKFTDENSRERYENYITTGGAHQVYANPFDFNWESDVTSPFGWRVHPISHDRRFHNGLDIAEPGGTPIKSVCTGTVITSEFSSSAGNCIVVQDVTGYTVHYMHLNERYVAVGTEIKKGELLGTVGTTGNSTGNHLHIGVKDEGGEWLNPIFLVSSFVE